MSPFSGTTVVLGRMGLVAPSNGPILVPHASGALSTDDMKKLSREICSLKCLPPAEGQEGASLCLENHMKRANPFGLQVLRPANGTDGSTEQPEPTPIKPFPTADVSTFVLEEGDQVCLGVPMAGRWAHYAVIRGADPEAPAAASVPPAASVAATSAAVVPSTPAPVASVHAEAAQPTPQAAAAPSSHLADSSAAASESKELIVAVGTLENVVGFIPLTAGMTIEGARQLILDEIDDDVLPPEGWKFMRMQLGRPVPVSLKQEKKLLAVDLLPTVVIATPAPPTAAAPFVTPAPVTARPASDVTTEKATSPKRAVPPPAPRFSMSSDAEADDDVMMQDEGWADEEGEKDAPAPDKRKGEVEDMTLSEDQAGEGEKAGQKRRQPGRAAVEKSKRHRRVEVESEEEDLFSLSDKAEEEEEEEVDEVMQVDESEEEEVEVEGEREGEAAAWEKTIDLPNIRKQCNALLTTLQTGLEKERQNGAPLRNTEQYKEEIQDTVLKSALLDTKVRRLMP